jgi:hypothetical protein
LWLIEELLEMLLIHHIFFSAISTYLQAVKVSTIGKAIQNVFPVAVTFRMGVSHRESRIGHVNSTDKSFHIILLLPAGICYAPYVAGGAF